MCLTSNPNEPPNDTGGSMSPVWHLDSVTEMAYGSKIDHTIDGYSYINFDLQFMNTYLIVIY